ncbi:MAG: LysM peptidoglycan-binding domain-containing M23 family metallopeptidase [Bacilli bacterium]|jgi:murein DD-endopeptidase MepM/ murein hydrolase activator NlpD
MGKVKIIMTVLMTMMLSFILILFFNFSDQVVSARPQELYKVYLDGLEIGIIKSKGTLENYIDKQQSAAKKKYGVDFIYPPNNLYIDKFVSYDEKILTEAEVYEKIKEISPFTVKGYIISIEGEEDVKKINVLDQDLFVNAVNTTIQAFVLKEEYDKFLNDEQEEIKTTGQLIEDLYIDEKISVKEAFIPVDEEIFIDENELSRYLLFGTLKEQDSYVVQAGDTIEDIAFNHKLGVGEFLLVNPYFTSSNNLLSEGQVVTVGYINPLFKTVVEKHIVEDQVKKYQTEIIYDSSAYYGSSYVKQEGKDGLERVVQKIKYVNGEITNAIFPSSEVLKAEVNEIIVKGTRTSTGKIVVSADGNWAWPTNSPYIISSTYGWRWGKIHDGNDISGTGYGSPIYAANHGVVYQTGVHSSLGNYVILSHENNYYTVYAHLARIIAKEGKKVTRGEVIGTMGSSGFSTGTHLHFASYIGVPYAAGSKSFDSLLLYR